MLLNQCQWLRSGLARPVVCRRSQSHFPKSANPLCPQDYFGATAAILYQTYAAAVHTGGRFVQRVKVPLALALTGA